MTAVAEAYMAAARPAAPDLHLLETEGGGHLFLPDGSRLYDADAALFDRGRSSVADKSVAGFLREIGLDTPVRIDDVPLEPPPVTAISLAVAQKCNLGCTYCYAEQGSFGAAPRNMTLDDARAAIDLLVAGGGANGRVNVAFLGGEPLVNRTVLKAATRYAVDRATAAGLSVRFSITTNGTLVTPEDAEFFEAHGFGVTVSVDGVGAVHDRLRSYRGGRGSYDAIMKRVAPLLQRQRDMQVSARVTVTPDNLDLPETLETFVAAGFHSVGFAPMLASPNGRGEMGRKDLARMLEAMIACGRVFEEWTLAGARYPFANMLTALKEIGRGTHRPYPCGAGAGYLAVAADRRLAACHRFVGDEAGAMGALGSGVDNVARASWLTERHVHRQEPCRSCWARYLCGGGCHHEVIARGRPACDYVRGWLHYCLEVYLRLSRAGAAVVDPG